MTCQRCGRDAQGQYCQDCGREVSQGIGAGEDARFDQSRKNAAASVEPQVRSCLTDYYDVAGKQVISTEHARDGEYQTGGNYRPTDLLDYAGVDWLVDNSPRITGVGERIRPNETDRRDFSWRLDNGCDRPCESDRIPAGLEAGIAPSTILFGWRTGNHLDRAWLLDTDTFIESLENGELHPDRRDTGDGTRAAYIPIGDLATAGCIRDSWAFSEGDINA